MVLRISVLFHCRSSWAFHLCWLRLTGHLDFMEARNGAYVHNDISTHNFSLPYLTTVGPASFVTDNSFSGKYNM